jgi:hypothetical protein
VYDDCLECCWRGCWWSQRADFSFTELELSCERRGGLGGSEKAFEEIHRRVIRDQSFERYRRGEWWDLAGCFADCELPIVRGGRKVVKGVGARKSLRKEVIFYI